MTTSVDTNSTGSIQSGSSDGLDTGAKVGIGVGVGVAVGVLLILGALVFYFRRRRSAPCAAGAAQGLEDAYILGELLSSVWTTPTHDERSSRTRIIAALKAYDESSGGGLHHGHTQISQEKGTWRTTTSSTSPFMNHHWMLFSDTLAACCKPEHLLLL